MDACDLTEDEIERRGNGIRTPIAEFLNSSVNVLKESYASQRNITERIRHLEQILGELDQMPGPPSFAEGIESARSLRSRVAVIQKRLDVLSSRFLRIEAALQSQGK